MNFKKYYKEKNINEMSLPPGFTPDMIGDEDEFIKRPTDEIEEDINDAEIGDVDVGELRGRKLDPKKYKQYKAAERPEKLIHKSVLFDVDGVERSEEEIIKILKVRPNKLISQNTKIAKSGTNQIFYDLTLPAFMGVWADEKTNTLKTIKTCPNADKCKNFCYAARGGYIMFSPSGIASSRLITFLMNDYEGFKSRLASELQSALMSAKTSGNKVVLRLSDSGDLLSESYLAMVYDIARSFPSILFYTYTKMVSMIKKNASNQPKNVIFNFSFGGTEDDLIDTKVDKHAVVVPKSVFSDLEIEDETAKYRNYTPKALKTLKQRVADKYNLDPSTVITYAEMIRKPNSKTKKWNVIVWKGAGDNSAARADVLGTYLLFH